MFVLSINNVWKPPGEFPGVFGSISGDNMVRFHFTIKVTPSTTFGENKESFRTFLNSSQVVSTPHNRVRDRVFIA
ncbi:hypothetical protein J6590_037054 [Homalodisca vitripennis]|nr:hypothetical protein J6590_037054 [Homalodisca vitripennis]